MTISRRDILKMGGTAALLSTVKASFPAGVQAAGSGPEVTKAVLGYIALTDAAPLVIAKEKGFFAKSVWPTSRWPSRPHGAPCATISGWARPRTASMAHTF